jgi:hypothetical protein
LNCPVTIEAAKRIAINNDPISHRWRRIRRALGAGASKVIVMWFTTGWFFCMSEIKPW